jgi:hypothetical protein
MQENPPAASWASRSLTSHIPSGLTGPHFT